MTLPELARLSVETYIKEGKIIEPPTDLSEEFLQKKSGVFVTIEENGELRSCIVTYLPTNINIAEEIIHNAIAAASKDYRFGPIKKEELPYLSYTVYILSEPKPVKNIKDLDPKKFGIIVKTTPFTYPSAAKDGKEIYLFNYPNEDVGWFDGRVPFKSGLLLPDLEGIDTIEKQIFIACQKGGIKPTKEKIIIYKFTAEKFK